MNDEIKSRIIQFVGVKLFKVGSSYEASSVILEKSHLKNDALYFKFIVQDQYRYWSKWEVSIANDFKNCLGSKCNCYDYYHFRCCEHVSAALIHYYKEIFYTDKSEYIKKVTKSLLEKVADSNQLNFNHKDELKLEIEIDEEDNVTLKIGIDHLYVARPKMDQILISYFQTKKPVALGKKYTFDPAKQYFNETDEKIMSLFYDKYLAIKDSYYYTSKDLFKFSNNSLKPIIKLLQTKGFIFKKVGFISEFVEEFPFDSSLRKVDNNFQLDFNSSNSHFLTPDCEYIISGNKCYHLKSRDAEIVKKIAENELEFLVFAEEDLELFSKSILSTFKEKIFVDETAKEVVITKKPTCKLYFDLNYNDIVCNIKLIYDNLEIDYFDSPKNLLRDTEFEKEALKDLLESNFIIQKNRIILSDMELIGEFLEEKIEFLSKKYETFTSQKINDIRIVKNAKIVSNFSIGKDNIVRFDFDLGDIASKELDHIFSDLKKKKKYFKLKNGSILNLSENKDLLELKELANELELSNSDFLEGNGIIPKYRALYLDSLKDQKYKIIQTDNLFDKFIEKFKNFKNIDLDFTEHEKSILRDYQKIGIKWLYNICKCDLGCILADEMGLGKSLQVICLIRQLINESKDSKYLIVVPTSLVYNWKNEFLKFAPELEFEIISGLKDKRQELLKTSKKNIYITSYGLLREDFDFYEKINFKVCVIDEAQNIKNPTAGITRKVKKINAETKIALTGTPIENSVIELWSIFDFIMPGFFTKLIDFQTKYKFKEFTEDVNELLFSLNKQISPFILRRKKKDVLTELPDKIENSIFIDLTENQKKLYAKEVEHVKKEVERITAEEGIAKARFLFLQLLTKLRQICIDPSIVYENYKEESSKMENLISIVKEQIENNHKILIFTSFRTALDIAKKKLQKENITCYSLDGSVDSKKRMELVEHFNSNDTKVFLIMLKAGGTGLNLTGADVVIHLDIWWNPQAENQATDRAHRIGQKNTVEVIKLIASGTIEERILELQEKKKTLSDKLIEGELRNQNILSSLSEEDIKDLLAYNQ